MATSSVPLLNTPLTAGSSLWDTCGPELAWLIGSDSWYPNYTPTLDPVFAALHAHEDYFVTVRYYVYWSLGGAQVRTEYRTRTWMNGSSDPFSDGSSLSDDLQINYAPGSEANSVLESFDYTLGGFAFTPIGYPTIQAKTLESMTFNWRQSMMDRSLFNFDRVNFQINFAGVTTVYRHTLSGHPELKTGVTGGPAWNFSRGFDTGEDLYGLAWEDCSGGGGSAAVDACGCERWTRRIVSAANNWGGRAACSGASWRRRSCPPASETTIYRGDTTLLTGDSTLITGDYSL